MLTFEHRNENELHTTGFVQARQTEVIISICNSIVLRFGAVHEDEEFKALTLAEQKLHLVELLDKNQLYVNLSSLNDKDFAITAEEKRFNHDFYKIKR